MAKISHPNVLQVFEVGVHHGQVFLALEFVEGTTLEGWLTARPRTWRAKARSPTWTSPSSAPKAPPSGEAAGRARGR